MVSIRIKSGVLIVEDPLRHLFNWDHRSFFNFALGFEIIEEKNRYILKDAAVFGETIPEIIEYLEDSEILFEFDGEISKFIAAFEKQNSEFQEAITNLDSPIDLRPPTSLIRELKSYQTAGLNHLSRIGHGANFSVPGSGKTSVIYAYFARLVELNIVEKIFVVGPFSSFAPWEDEAEKCFGRKIRSARLVGNRRNTHYVNSQTSELFLCHYQTAANDKEKIIELCRKHRILLVIDESHYIKSFSGGVRSDALLSISPYATRRVILSGTPMPNGFLDLWSQMTFLWPGKQVLGEKNAYRTRVDNQDEREQIKTEIRPFFFRVKKSDLGLPKPEFERTRYALKPIQSQIYSALTTRLLSDLKLKTADTIKLRQWKKAKMVRLLQAACNPSLLSKYSEEFQVPPLTADGSTLIELIEKYSQFEIPAKFDAAINLTKKLVAENRKVILWTTFIHNIKMLETGLVGIDHYSIHGAIPRDNSEDEDFNREKEIHSFKTSTTPCVLIANPAACAESISLHKICHDAIYVDRSFNCGQYIQSLDRIHRIGLAPDEIVKYHILIAANTIDETIDRRLDEKHELMVSVLEDDIPIGGLDVEGYEMELTESEETRDFEETISDLGRYSN